MYLVYIYPSNYIVTTCLHDLCCIKQVKVKKLACSLRRNSFSRKSQAASLKPRVDQEISYPAVEFSGRSYEPFLKNSVVFQPPLHAMFQHARIRCLPGLLRHFWSTILFNTSQFFFHSLPYAMSHFCPMHVFQCNRLNA